jgi:MSHA pilin protein MshD
MRDERGAMLIEIVISIVVIAIAASAVLGLLSSTNAHSGDAMITAQAVSIGEAYLEEISLKPFADPDGTDGEAGRVNFDDVDDYDGLVDSGARDQFDNAIPPLSGYAITVDVSQSGALAGVPAADALRIDVRVTFAPLVDLSLTGYRTRL